MGGNESVLGRPLGRSVPTRTERRLLWAAALASYGVGDLLTTVLGLALGAVERHSLAAWLIAETSLPETALLLGLWKLLVLAGFYLLSSRVGDAEAGVPLGLTVLGSVVVGWNTAIVLLLLTG